MTDRSSSPLPTNIPRLVSRTPLPLCLVLLLAALALAGTDLAGRLPVAQWLPALLAPAEDDMRQVLLHFNWLPRLCMAALCGAALALAGTLMQQVLHNPLASPDTLGVASGAQLALVLARLWAPALLVDGREWVALAGGGLSALLVFALAWRRGLAPLTVILAGLAVSLYLGALGKSLLLTREQDLGALLVWSSGSLVQNGWQDMGFLLPRLAAVLLLMLPLLRPLALLELDDSGARNLGVSLGPLRGMGLALAVYLSACVTSSVGVIGCVGLAAPAIARLLGARRFAQRLFWAPLLGAALLLVTDLAVQRLAGQRIEPLSTGSVASLLGAPLLLWLLPRLQAAGGHSQVAAVAPWRHPYPWRRLALLGALLLLATPLALGFGQGPHGWDWRTDAALLDLRLPRLVAALAAGTLLALAGTLMQRLTANPMASPELLGLGTGALLGLTALLFLLPGAGLALKLSLGAGGALAVLLLIVALSYRSGFVPERVLLIGIALTVFFDALQAISLADGDPRGLSLLGQMADSAYFVDAPTAWTLLAGALLLFAATLPCARWLELLPLGEGSARALGVPLARSRLCLLLLATLTSAGATLLVGPLSFVGLLAPHLARRLGLARVLPQLLGASLLGALILLLADWLGRNLLFPLQLPAGLLAPLVGGACFMLCLRRR
ncbi:Fe(3+)-hydroxamate ABC transporter permease FhuB [Azorhizophilus paspali]|uniref:Fe(3+)-hydroxamate ABC transporter permease FhuB n=1 Tax=Azorhizophilus paspali TaxID=69963 RepID=A0ABV6SQD8_AZOPA